MFNTLSTGLTVFLLVLGRDLGVSGGPLPRCRSITPAEAPEHGAGAVICFQLPSGYTICTVRCSPGYIMSSDGAPQTCGRRTLNRWGFRDIRDSLNCTKRPNTYQDETNHLPRSSDQLTSQMQITAVQRLVDTYHDMYSQPGGNQPKCDYDARFITSSGVTEFKVQAASCYNTSTTDVTIAPSRCQIPSAPVNGGLVCYSSEGNIACSSRCNAGFDKTSSPVEGDGFKVCRSDSGWSSHTMEQCIQEFFPGVRLLSDDHYFQRHCSDLTEQETQQIKEAMWNGLRRSNLEGFPATLIPNGGRSSINCGINEP